MVRTGQNLNGQREIPGGGDKKVKDNKYQKVFSMRSIIEGGKRD